MRRIVIVLILVFAAAVLFAGAAGRQDTKPAQPMMPGMMMRGTMPGMMSGMMANMPNSPMNIPGLEVTVADVPNGVTVTYTTKTGDVTELRRRVRQRVEMMQQMRNWMTTAKPDASK